MKRMRAGLGLLIVQVLLVLSVAGKYWYERKTCPRVWVRSVQVDPQQPLRGRYLALHLLVDTCGLPRNAAHFTQGYKDFKGVMTPGFWDWEVSLGVDKGRLAPRWEDHPMRAEDVHHVRVPADKPCGRAPLQDMAEYFVPEHAKGPFPLARGQELWTEVTVPPSGPPRPIQLATSRVEGFRLLRFE